MGVEEVHGEDEAGGQQGFVGVDDEGDVDDPAGQEGGEELREPHDHAGNANGKHAPEHREVVELFPIRPAVELRLGGLAEEPFLVGHEFTPVLQAGDHGIRPEQDLEEALCLPCQELSPNMFRAH